MSRTERTTRIGYQIATGRILTTVLLTRAPGWTWLCVGLASLGVYLSLNDNYYTEHGGEPREPLACTSFRIAYSRLGQTSPNIPGLVEAAAYVPLALVGSWLMAGYPPLTRLLCVACAVGFVASCLCAIAVDPAFYNPDTSWSRLAETLRATGGFIAALVAATVILTAPWDRFSWWIAAALCGSLILVHPRIRETDRAFAAARGFSDNEQIVGRQAITRHLHSMVGTPLEAMNAAMGRYRGHDPDLYDSYRSVVGGYRELLGMDEAADLGVDWPGLLASHLRALGGRYGTLFRFSHPNRPLHRADRVLAHLVLDDMATNAAKAGATECDVTLTMSRSHCQATTTDNGRPIDPATWLREGGGMRRLDNELIKLGGGVSYEELPDGRKQVIASWTARDDATDTPSALR